MDLFNTRFTADKPCSLSAILMLANPWNGAPTCRVYIWNSDGTFPTNKIDSIDVQLDPANIGRWSWTDVSELGLSFSGGEDFHVGFTTVNMQPGERVDLHAGVPVDSLPVRSSLMHNGEWVFYDDLDPENHNFDIRVVVVEEPAPEIEITTLSIPPASLKLYYDETIEVEGGTPPYFWDLTAGYLPEGITLDGSTGVISGQPTTLDTAHFTVRVRDNNTPSLTDIQILTLVTWSDDDCCIGIRGNVNGDALENINISDVTYLVDYLFGIPLGPAPKCLTEGNANGDNEERVNISDITYLIEYLYGVPLGPAPPDCP